MGGLYEGEGRGAKGQGGDERGRQVGGEERRGEGWGAK